MGVTGSQDKEAIPGAPLTREPGPVGEAGGVSTGERGHWEVWAVGMARNRGPPQPGCCSAELGVGSGC